MMLSPLDLLFPPKCAMCQGLLTSSRNPLCPCCKERLTEFPREWEKSVRNTFRCTVAFPYRDEMRDAIHSMKFENRPRIAAVLGSYLAEAVAARMGGEFDAVTYVPVSRARLYERGYDQSRLIAKAMADLWAVPLYRALNKIHHNAQQASLTNYEKRVENVKGCYAPTSAAKGKRFLLVDDVLTTGSTMHEAAMTLLTGGALSVVCCAAASPRAEAE